ncbi:MAG TPA: hypothetical protein VHE34_09415 [Puia sp.]|uniref:hypothetical protein n=1 Tax=Puia sp. TaxID=2045100 RepID=UPI002C366281|nr:hypothetical protein [Puia sp.]HVU95432.1 hypothetical protein [Puia sp.]
MTQLFTLTYEKRYHFRFEFDFDQLVTDGVFYYPMFVKLYRQDDPSTVWEWRSNLFPHQKVEFRLDLPDSINMKGSLTIFHSQPSKEDLLFLDVFFGSQYEEHYEGNAFVLGPDPNPPPPDPVPPFPPIPPVPPPDPPVPPADDPAPDPGEDRVLPSGYHDLFPFLQLRFWPDLSPAEEELFIEYVDNGTLPPSADLYTQLLALKHPPSARAKMEAEARQFINGGAGYAGLFIEKIDTLPYPFDKYTEIYHWLMEHEELPAQSLQLALPTSSTNTIFSFGSSDYALQLNIIWQNVIALAIINGYRASLLESLLKILVVDHLLQYVFASEMLPPVAPLEPWRRLIRSSVVLPGTLFPLPVDVPKPLPDASTALPDPPATLVDPSRFSGQVTPYAIGCLQKVQHFHTGYALGEIAQVDNIAIGEVKQIKHRHTQFTEEKTDHRTANQDDHHGVTSGAQLEQAVSHTLDQTIKNEWDFTRLSISYGPPTTGTYDGKVTEKKDTNLNSDGANRFARKILSQAVDRVAQAVIHHRQTTFRQETEDMTIRTIDNRRGTRNIRSIYRWLNKLYQLRLVDYGRRFIIELLIEQPARLPMQLLSYKDITVENYSQLAARYGVTGLPHPPLATRKITTLLDNTNPFPAKSLPVPEGYQPISITASYKVAQAAVLIAGTKQVSLSAADSTVTIPDPMQLDRNGAADAVPILLDLTSTDPYYCSIVMECAVSAATISDWQLSVFDRIEPAYRATQQKDQPSNPQMEERSHRLLVADACLAVLYQLHKDGSAAARPEYTQFFDEAFEWPEMSYSIKEDRWPHHMRVLLPVRPNYSFRVLYYLSTGIPFYGNDPLTPVIETQKNIAAALQRAEREGRGRSYETQLDSWQVTVPTSMQWLQDGDQFPGTKTPLL